MQCPDCTEARRNPHSAAYRVGCFGCQMRGFARSRLAFDAVKSRSTADLRAALALSHPNVEPEVALRAIWDWWRHEKALKEQKST